MERNRRADKPREKVYMFWMKTILLAMLLFSPILWAEDDEGFNCETARKALEEVQYQQVTLKSDESFKTFLELEQDFDRERAHLILLKGMQKLNNEYRNFKKLLAKQGLQPPHSPNQLLQLSGELLKHHESVHQVDVADQILRVLSSDAPETQAAIKKLISSDDDITNVFNKHCQESDAKNDCRWYSDNHAPTFVSNMQYLLSDVASKESRTVNCKGLGLKDCTHKKWERFQGNIHNYRNALMDDIAASHLQSDFANEEWEKVEDSRQKLSECTGSCTSEVQQLNLAIVAYRDKVRELENQAPAKAWDALKKFNTAADNLRTDTWKEATINQNRIERFVRTRNPEITLTDVEKAKAQMQIAQKEIVDILAGDSYSQSREKLRKGFAENTHLQLEDFFSHQSVNERIKHFNPVLQELVGSERRLLEQDARGNIVLNAEVFFDHIDKIEADERRDLQKNIEKEIIASRLRLQTLSKDMDSIKSSEDWKQGEQLKRYVFERSHKNNCEHAGDTVSIRCAPNPDSGEQRTLTALHKDFNEILAVMDTSQPAEPVKAFREICKSSSRYLSACMLANREFRRRYPAGTIADLIKESKNRTIVYNDRGRRVDYIVHDKTTSEILFDGFVGALNQPQTINSLHLLLSQSFYKDQLNSYVESAQQEKTWYHQSEQYQEYAEQRWVEDMFEQFHLQSRLRSKGS